MAKVTSVKEPDEKKIFRLLTFDEIDEVNWKLHITISTVDVLTDADNGNVTEDSRTTLAMEARDRPEEARDILNPDSKGKTPQ